MPSRRRPGSSDKLNRLDTGFHRYDGIFLVLLRGVLAHFALGFARLRRGPQGIEHAFSRTTVRRLAHGCLKCLDGCARPAADDAVGFADVVAVAEEELLHLAPLAA